MRYPSLGDHFERVRRYLPALTAGAQPLGAGNYGIVISQPDDRVAKILWQPEEGLVRQRIWSEGFLRREVAFYKAMENIPVHGLDVPRLVSDPQTLGKNGFMAVYTMTRVGGYDRHWGSFSKEESPRYFTVWGVRWVPCIRHLQRSIRYCGVISRIILRHISRL